MADLKPKPPTTAWGQAFERALQAGFSVVIGFLGGYYADRWLGTPYIFMVLGFIVGGIAAVRALLQIPVPPPNEASANSGVAGQSDSGRRPTASRNNEGNNEGLGADATVTPTRPVQAGSTGAGAGRDRDWDRDRTRDLWDEDDDE